MKLLSEFGITFKDEKLIETALTHTSYSNENNCESYERLEFLGDAVLELVSTDYIYNKTKYAEGEMSRMRSLYVCENALYEYAGRINLKEHIRLGNGVKEANKTVIADVFEAVIAVIYIEHGINMVKRLFNKLIVPYIESDTDFLRDYKSLLQESVQSGKKSVTYKLISDSGPAHNKSFKVSVIVGGKVFGTGIGKSKKEAEQNAAKEAYSKCANMR